MPLARWVGCPIMLRGLGRADLNGRKGVVVAIAPSLDRLGVRLNGELKTLAVKPENLRMLTLQLDSLCDDDTLSVLSRFNVTRKSPDRKLHLLYDLSKRFNTSSSRPPSTACVTRAGVHKY